MKLQGIFSYIKSHRYHIFIDDINYADLANYNNTEYKFSNDGMVIAISDFGIYGLLEDDNLVILDENETPIRNVDVDQDRKISTLFLDLIYATR